MAFVRLAFVTLTFVSLTIVTLTFVTLTFATLTFATLTFGTLTFVTLTFESLQYFLSFCHVCEIFIFLNIRPLEICLYTFVIKLRGIITLPCWLVGCQIIAVCFIFKLTSDV